MKQPRWVTGEAKFTKAKKIENRLADELGGKRLARSGGLAWSKWDKSTQDGDIKTDSEMLEHKYTEKASMSIKKAWLDKVSQGASKTGRYPALVITFVDGDKEDDWVLVPMSIYKKLRGAAE